MPEPLNASTPIEFLKGIGPKRAEALAEDLGIRTCGDLLFHLPFRYEDRTRFHRVAEAVPGPVQAPIPGHHPQGQGGPAETRTQAGGRIRR